MASLVEVARAMERNSQHQQQPVAPEESVAPTKPGLSLVDIAREQQQIAEAPAAVKPVTLMDVARNKEASESAKSTLPAVSLQSLAKEINDEERKRIDKVITTTATDVKAETIQQRANVLKAAATEVRREDEARQASKPQQNPTNDASALEQPTKPSQRESSALQASDYGADGYSSFEDHERKSAKTPSPPAAKKKAPKGRVKQDSGPDNQSESGSDAGPEKTTPRDSPAAKEFLRAIYRGDSHRVREMMRDDDMDASTADQHGWCALHWAASQDQAEILALLLGHKNARVDAVEHVNGWTALHLAVMRDAVACVKRLLRAGASVGVCDLYGDRALDLLKAVKGKKKERLLQLLHSK